MVRTVSVFILVMLVGGTLCERLARNSPLILKQNLMWNRLLTGFHPVLLDVDQWVSF